MFLFFESNVYNNSPPQDNQEPEEEQSQEDAISQEIDTSVEPMKRYYLVSKLMKLKSNLDVVNYDNPVLSVLITFIDNISYQNLVIIVPKLLEVIEQDLKRINNNEK
ncbi:MAG: hypothetical protein ACOC33_00735 [bacterium]